MNDKFFETTIQAGRETTAKRIDQYLLDYFKQNSINEEIPGLIISRTRLQQFIQTGRILVNEMLVKQSYMVKQGDVLSVKIPLEFKQQLSLRPEKIYFDIIYNDETICVINKPLGIVVHPAHGHFDHTLINGFLYLFPELGRNSNLYRLGLVHRLDKDTSGIMLMTKNEAAQYNLAEQFKMRTIQKEYWAIVCGHLENDNGEISTRIGRNPIDRKRMSVLLTNGKESLTTYKVIRYLKNGTLVRLLPHTGRTHQLRVHMNYLKHPIAGDSIYCKRRTDFHHLGLMLCAKKISFLHPIHNYPMQFEIDLPDRFKVLLEKGEC